MSSSQLNTTHVLWIGDCSGSMWPLVRSHHSGYNKLLQEQAKRTEDNCNVLMGLITFNSEHKIIYYDRPIQECSPEPLETFGVYSSTALYDTIFHSIELMKNTMETVNISDPFPENHTYMLQIMTDGEDTSSTLHTLSSIGNLIEKYQSEFNWIINFYAANQKAEDVGTAMNIHRDRCITFTPDAFRLSTVLKRASETITRCSKGLTRGFTQDEKFECSPMEYSQSSASKTVAPTVDTIFNNNSDDDYDDYDDNSFGIHSPPPLNRIRSYDRSYSVLNSNEQVNIMTQPDFDMDINISPIISPITSPNMSPIISPLSSITDNDCPDEFLDSQLPNNWIEQSSKTVPERLT